MGADVPVFIVLGTPDGDGWFGPMGWCFCGGGGVWSLGIGRWMYVFDGRTAGGAAGDVEGVGRNCGYLCEFLVLKGTNRYRSFGAVYIHGSQFFAFVSFLYSRFLAVSLSCALNCTPMGGAILQDSGLSACPHARRRLLSACVTSTLLFGLGRWWSRDAVGLVGRARRLWLPFAGV